MAAEKVKAEKELSVEERLKAVYDLQTILSEIDRIKTLRGELPLEVQDLEDDVAGLETRLSNLKEDLGALESNVAQKKVESAASKEKVERYKTQLDSVSNNKEFDALTKEIEFESLNIELADKRIKEFNVQAKMRKEEIEVAKAAIEGRKGDLEAKKAELEEIINETKMDEEKLRLKAKNLEATIEPRLLAAFKRIRKNARNGLGIVYVERDACGGCFNKIPAQRQLDIRMHKKIIVCEYCGRVMIDPELAGVEPR